MEAALINRFLSVSSGDGSGSGSGYGYGDGSGSGSGYGYGVQLVNDERVYLIDDVQTIIRSIRGNIAKGAILNDDLTLTQCFIAKGAILNDDLTLTQCFIAKVDNSFAHGETLKQALAEAQEKAFDNKPLEKRISAMLEEIKPGVKYSGRIFYKWHHILTGSCTMGRDQFVAQGGYDLDRDTFTVEEFIEITKNSYGRDAIKALAEEIERRKKWIIRRHSTGAIRSKMKARSSCSPRASTASK